MEPITRAELDAALPHLLSAPQDQAPIEQLCLRPGYGQRQFVQDVDMTRDRGIPGERWLDAPWLRLENGRPDPRIQVSILGRRITDLVWRDRNGTPHPGDTIIADLDCSQANMPEGQLLQVGTARLRVSGLFNDACAKWKSRYGADAWAFVRDDRNRRYRLRGILCEVVGDGRARIGDPICKIAGDSA